MEPNEPDKTFTQNIETSSAIKDDPSYWVQVWVNDPN